MAGGYARPVVEDFEIEHVAAAPGSNRDRADGGPRGHTVADRVLDERLHDHVRHDGIEDVRRDIDLHVEPFAESGLLDLEVRLEEVQLVREGDFLFARVIQRRTQQLAQSGKHPVAAFTSLCISAEIVFIALNRKCGCSCDLSTSSSAFARRDASTAASASRWR